VSEAIAQLPERLPVVEPSTASLSEYIHQLHRRIRESHPSVKRLAFALYDQCADLLKTFVSSTDDAEPLTRHEQKLSETPSLLELAARREDRTIRDLHATLQPLSRHSRWVLDQGYRSSFTMPIYRNRNLLGFVFFDSTEVGTFTPELRRELMVYASLIGMLFNSELTALRTLVGATRLAQDFAHFRDPETGDHLERMARYARLIAQHLAPDYGLSDEFIEQIFLFAPMHDIGKVGIPDAVLLKPGKLDEQEWQIMARHVEIGRDLVNRVVADLDLTAFPNVAMLSNIVGLHHEKLDGSGYPHGLRGDDIPLEARIIATADIFDALSTERPYKKAWSVADSLHELQRLATAGKLDPRCVAAMVERRSEVMSILAAFPGA